MKIIEILEMGFMMSRKCYFVANQQNFVDDGELFFLKGLNSFGVDFTPHPPPPRLQKNKIKPKELHVSHGSNTWPFSFGLRLVFPRQGTVCQGKWLSENVSRIIDY